MSEVRAAPVALDPRVRVVPAAGVLHVYSRRGDEEIRGRNVEVLHGRLEPYLHGTHSEEQLVAAVPPSRAGAVRSLLVKLREAGVLYSAGSEASAIGRPGDGSWGDSGQDRRILERRASMVRLLLDDVRLPLPGEGPVLAFLTPDRAAGWLLGIGGERDLPKNWTCIVVVPEGHERVEEPELRRRAEYARWLLGTVFDPAPDSAETWLFRLSSPEGTLEGLARLTKGQSGQALFDSLSSQLGLVKAADCDQLPLVVLTPSQVLFPPSGSYYGLRLEEVRVRAATDCLLTAKMGSAPRVAERPGTGFRPVRSGVVKAAVEASSAEERASAGDLSNCRWEPVDLLSLPAEHPDIEYLQGVLRLRRRAFRAERTVGPGGAVLLRCSGGSPRAASLLPHKAVADLLLKAVLEEFYATWPGAALASPVSDHLRFAAEDELARTVRSSWARLSAAGSRSEAVCRRTAIWGREVWWSGSGS